MTKLKTFTDNKLKVTKMMIVLFHRVENTVGKGENVGYQHFLLFPHCFPKPSSIKLGLCGKELNIIPVFVTISGTEESARFWYY